VVPAGPPPHSTDGEEISTVTPIACVSNTEAAAGLLKRIGKTLPDERFDRLDEDSFETTKLMVWWEEQRAIGEMMRVPNAAGAENLVRPGHDRLDHGMGSPLR
jgi:hypothetical protein